PVTVKCPCRNAYRVEAPPVPPNAAKSTVDQIWDFISSIFGGPESEPKKGILQGAVSPRPVLTCAVGKKVQLGDILKPGQYQLRVRALNETAKNVTWQTENAEDRLIYTGDSWGSLLGTMNSSQGSLVMGRSLEEPALYEIDAKLIGTNAPPSAVW